MAPTKIFTFKNIRARSRSGSLRRKIFWGVLLSLLVSIIGVGGLLLHNTKKDLNVFMEQHAKSVLSYLHYVSRKDIINMNYDALISIVEKQGDDPMIQFISFYDYQGKLIASNRGNLDDKASYKLYENKVGEQNKLFGTIKVAIKNELPQQMLRISVKTLLINIAILLVISPIISLLISGTIVRSLNSILKPMQTIGKQLSHTSDEINHGSRILSTSVDETAISLQQNISAIEELSELIKYDSENAVKVLEHSDHSHATTQKGQSEIVQLDQAMLKIDVSFQKIESTVALIESIAFQTNLLALNAAVEAARAGDSGRGFATVAESVRELAEKISISVKEIKGLIAVSRQEVAQGEVIVHHSEKILEEIVCSSDLVNNLNKDIAITGKEHLATFAQITQALTLIDSATQQTSSMAEEGSTQAGQLNQNALNIHNAIKELHSIIS
ncbi:MAG: hypothetical protein HN353_12710 [Bdellovibrionales bacterium]|jgi:methyl-accepting chemotaxis protein|nr:hypothetical protein [Bdellovibrionales bacterium]MBT3526379.1 hypothetical protein [Bdellovibrionales bacterium]MBT7668449.1 hypothetical protein [Bdellovibrionales bacterium]MBT7768303.1 hypothetical protein [Bdellovibrionales bacterium]